MITGHRLQKLQAELMGRTHRLIADVPPTLGGDDQGPNPHELIEAALTACTIITCQMYADRHQWKLVSTDVEVKIVEETNEKSQISRKIRFTGELTDEQRASLLEIADKCPIHRLLQGQISILTSPL